MYTIKEASARSGVGIPLLRAWERRYGVVAPTRTDAGYRLYDADAIARLIAMRQLIAEGWAPQQAAARVRSAASAELAALGARPMLPADAAGSEHGGPETQPEHERLVDRIVSSAEHLNSAELSAALDETFAMLRFESAWEVVLRPALRRIGDGWHRGEIDVAGEHATSQMIHRRMAMAYDAAGVPSADPPVLVGLAPGARHEFGALAFATAARRAGLPVLYLGPDLPVDSWVAAARERRAPAAVVGVPRRVDVEQAKSVATALRRESVKSLILLGGAHADRVETPGVHRLPNDTLVEAVTVLRRVLREH